MLANFRNHLQAPLTSYINELDINTVTLGVGNIAYFDGTVDMISNPSGANLLMSMVKIEEEPALKNFPNQKLQFDAAGNPTVVKKQPKIFINYYIMFVSVVQYDMAIAAIHRVIKYFQNNRKFSFVSDGNDIELTMEIVSPTFEQMNHIWGTLGGKQYPHIIYKARVMDLQMDVLGEVVPAVSRITNGAEVSNG